jgi:hypothetical protein
MNKRNAIITLILTVSLCFLYTSMTFSQQATSGEKKEKLNEAEAPDDSYLARFHAIRVVDTLMEENLNNIYMLKVIVSNFSDKGWNDEYQKVYDGYKSALGTYYKRDVIYARVGLEKNREDIYSLLKKVYEEYKKDTTQMLDECAVKVLNIHLDATTRTDPDKNDALRLNQMRLRIAYGQLDDAIGAQRDHYYKGSIFHLRVSKAYAIRILEDLANPDERKNVQDKYKKDKADNLNRVLGLSEKSGQTQSK